MGNSESSAKTDHFGEWEDEQSCNCWSHHWKTYKIQLQLSKYLNDGFFKYAPTHESFVAYYKCESCNEKFKRTYDIINSEKRARFGGFLLLEKIIQKKDWQVPYSVIEGIADELYNEYASIPKSFKDFTKDLFKKVAEVNA